MYRRKDQSKLKMIDLGLSSNFKRDKQEIRGTANFMAPEVWEGFYGPEADMWSCGVVLYAMLTGEELFPIMAEESELKRLGKDRKWIRGRLRRVREANVSKEAADLLNALLHHDRHQRLTAREALHHPFFKRWSEKASQEALRRRLPDYAQADSEAKKILDNLLQHFEAFAAEPVLVRAVLLLMAHIGAYTFEETRCQRAAFGMLDKDSSGSLSLENLEEHYLPSKSLTWQNLEDAFGLVDIDDDGYITYIEFLSATLPRNVRRNESLCRIIFDILDRNKDGRIDTEDLVMAFREGKDQHGVCRESLKEVCGPGGVLTWEQFRRLICGS